MRLREAYTVADGEIERAACAAFSSVANGLVSDHQSIIIITLVIVIVAAIRRDEIERIGFVSAEIDHLRTGHAGEIDQFYLR